MAERTLKVSIVGDERDLVRAFRASERSARTFNTRLSRSGAAFSTFAKSAGIAAAAAGAGLTVLATKGVSATSDLNEEINKSNVLFGQSSESIQRWSRTTAASLGLSRRAALEAGGNFGAMFATLNLGDDVSAKMSRRLVRLGADLASFSNQRPEDMLDRLRSGLAGEAEPLRRFGILISAARVEQEALRLGLVKAGGELTEQAKVQARFSLILRDSGKAQGDFARTSTSLANAQRIARAQIENLAAGIGNALLPAVARGLTAFNKFLPAISASLSDLSNRVGPVIAKLVGEFSSRLPELQRIASSILDPLREHVFPVAREVIQVIGNMFSRIVTVFDENSGHLRKILGNLGETLAAVWTVARPTIVFLLEKVLPLAIRILIPLIEKITGVTRVMSQVFVRVVSTIVKAIDNFLGALSTLTDAASHLPFIGDKFAGISGKVNASRDSLRKFAADLDALNGRKVNVTVRAVLPGDREEGAAGLRRLDQAAKATTETAAKHVQERTVSTGKLTKAIDTSTVVTRAAKTAAEKQREAFDQLMDVLGLRRDRAAATRGLAGDLKVLNDTEKALREQVAVEGRTVELERQLFELRQERARLQQQQRKGRQFEALGLTSEGQERVPGVGALGNRLGTIRGQLKGTFLDTEKMRSRLQRIAKVLSGQFGGVSRDVRSSILQMFNEIASALQSGTKTVEKSTRTASGEITRGGIRSTQALLRGMSGLSEEERRIIQQRNLGVSGPRGQSAFGFAVTGEPRTSSSAAGFGGGLGGAMIFNLYGDVVTNDPNDLMKKLQKKARRSSGGRRGRHGGANLGMQ